MLHHADALKASTRQRLRTVAAASGKAVAVAPVFDTIKLAQDGFVRETLNRDELAWPVAWANRPGLDPETDPPSGDWFVGAVAFDVEEGI